MKIAFENPMHRNSDRDSGTMSRLSDRVSQLRQKGGRKSTLTEPLNLGISQPRTGEPTNSVEVLTFENPTHPRKEADEAPGQPCETKVEQEDGLIELEEDTDTTGWGALKQTAKADQVAQFIQYPAAHTLLCRECSLDEFVDQCAFAGRGLTVGAH